MQLNASCEVKLIEELNEAFTKFLLRYIFLACEARDFYCYADSNTVTPFQTQTQTSCLANNNSCDFVSSWMMYIRLYSMFDVGVCIMCVCTWVYIIHTIHYTYTLFIDK